ncbi:MAG: translation initiation factor IF-2 [Candidatus Saccharimonadales bacterium]
MATTIQIEDNITVGTLAERLKLPVTRLIGELMKNGILATINERLDFDTAQIIVGELGLDVELVQKTEELTVVPKERQKRTGDHLSPRPPVVAVMGHVDHGKTTLLDAIRGAHVAQGEAGGITQHISAYQVSRGDRLITFLDTPGHEAFAAIREHSALLTDIVIIVVAADDGVKPQTIEAIRYARKAGVRIIVAINKMDKEGANPNLVKQQLAEQDLLVEDWGGDIVALPVSAKAHQGIDELLDMILLVSDVEELQADATVSAQGLIIEAHIEQGRGPVAHALIEEGTLKAGDFVVSGATYAKIRNLESTSGQVLKTAGPSTPVVISGFKTLPEFGEAFRVVANEKLARSQAEKTSISQHAGTARSDMSGSELLRIMSRSDTLQELPIIVKADVQGSLTSVADSLKSADTDEVAVRIVESGVGAINDNDIYMAHSSGAIVYGFGTTIPSNIKRIASRDKVSVRLYNVIYELIDDVRTELGHLLAPEVIEKVLGVLEVKAVFKTTKSEVICGGEVLEGKLTVPALARIDRGKEMIAEAKVTQLKRASNDAKEIATGELCGISLSTDSRVELQEGDKISVFTRETRARSL